jgi:O-antigen ligase
MLSLLARPAIVLLLVLPWIQPLSAGPSRNAWPWLVSMACLGSLLLLRRYWRAELLASATLLAALISCLIALIQYLGWASYGSPWMVSIGPGEGAGNLRQRNQFASLTALGLVSLAYLHTVRRDGGQRRLTGLTVFALPMLAIGHATTGSRSGLLAWALIVTAGMLWYWQRQRRIALLLGLGMTLYLLTSLYLPAVLQWTLGLQGLSSPCTATACDALTRLMTSANDSRLTLWRNVWTLILQRPWTGWGWNELDYAHYMTLFEGPRFMEKLGNAHHLPLHLAVEIGLPLALGLSVAVLAAFWYARPRERSPNEQVAAWAALLVIGLHSLLEYPLWYGPFQITALFAVLGLWRGIRPGQTEAQPTPKTRHRDALINGSALVLLLGTAVVAFDYHRVSQIYLPAAQRHSLYRSDPLQHAQGSWFFQGHAQFAKLALSPLTADNASEQLQLAQELLHHSPEPLVIERLLNSAELLGETQIPNLHSQRYRAAYPLPYALWMEAQRRTHSLRR